MPRTFFFEIERTYAWTYKNIIFPIPISKYETFVVKTKTYTSIFRKQCHLKI